jgi:hypothetical protein
MARKKEAAKGRMSGTDVALIASAVLVLALGGLAWALKVRHEKMDVTLQGDKKHFEEMKLRKQKMQEFKLRDAKGIIQARDEKPEDLTAFIGRTATKVGLEQKFIGQIAYEGERKSPPWREYAITVNLNGQKDSPVPHTTLVDFLSAIEKERPYLKSKNLTLVFTGSDYQRVQATISYFRKD